MDNYANPYPYNCYPPPPSSSSQPHPNPYESPPNLYISPFTSFPPQSPHLNPQLNHADPSQYPLVYPSPSFDPHYQPYPYPDPNSSSFHHGGSSHYDPSPSPSLSSSSSASSFHPINEDLASMHISDPGADAGSQHGSLKVLLLHGKLDVTVKEAKNLPDAGFLSKTIGNFFSPSESVPPSGELGKSGKSDAYVKIMIGPVNIGATYVVRDNENPAWMQHFNLPVAHETAAVTFEVMDNVLYPRHIGSVSIPAGRVYSGEKVEGTYPIIGTNGNPCKNGAMLSLSIQYIPMARLSLYYQGVGYGPDYYGVPNTYFQNRKGCKVTLYQDAHVPDGCLPDLRLDYGMHYNHGKCWQDIYVAINQARRLVYITGWSVFETVHLVRDGDNASSLALGELLKSKSQDGVRVLLLVWDDPTSKSILFLKKTGIMDTHDEEIQHFFKHSSVQVLLCPRSAGKHNSWFRQQETRTIFTHHQKTVVVDADAGNGKRKIVAFIGGLDLCGGRYDTPRHPLFRTLQTLHMDDYHNPNFVGPDARGPREPWHDLHSKIDGPAAYDILKNFEERWLKASKRHGIKKLGKSHDDALLKIKRIPDIIDDNNPLYLTDTEPETWHVQIFRSIDSNSVKGFPKDPRAATRENLVCGKSVLIDMSIHAAYVHAIRAAQHFIYIENQYFLGSSFNWHSNKDSGANNLIPIEIALKIANKIRANERFSAYIVLPMWPEGSPTGATTQMILFWQNKTMWMMYETIYRALKEVGLEDQYEPQDYLNFFCLGNREAEDINNPSDGIPHAPNTPQEHARKNRRFMIYVHSKGMIVDDEYVIIGSANINQRSLEGTRDTEIAMGAYQPQYTWAKKFSAPRGQIYGYRMSLWAEHIGTLEESFSHPESLDCMRRVRALGELNWRQFAADEVTEMRGHLLKYPVDVDRKGKVSEVMHNLKESFNYAESLECVRPVRTVGEQNWIQFAADAITEMRSHLLKYPVDVDRKALTWLQDLPGYWWKYMW